LLPERIATYTIGAGLPDTDATTFVGTLLTAPAKLADLRYITPAILAAAMEGSRWAYAEALKVVWYASILFGVLAVGIACAMPDIRKYMSERVAATVGRY
jgi:hypothetical protein